jgi:hypothetical protein
MADWNVEEILIWAVANKSPGYPREALDDSM